jgi:hypothetical protein
MVTRAKTKHFFIIPPSPPFEFFLPATMTAGS